MKPGQTTVLGLLIVLLALEAVRLPAVKNFLSTWLATFKQGLNNTTSSGGSGKPTSTDFNNGQKTPVPLTSQATKQPTKGGIIAL